MGKVSQWDKPDSALFHLPLNLIFFVFLTFRALINRSTGLVQPDLTHLTAAPITMVLLNAKDEFAGCKRGVTFHIIPEPAIRELAVSTIFRVNDCLFAPFILSDEVPFHRVTCRKIVCWLDAVAWDLDRSSLDSYIDFKSSSITLEVTFAALKHHLRCIFSIVN